MPVNDQHGGGGAWRGGGRVVEDTGVALARADGPDPVANARARLDAVGRAYVEFATTEPGWFRTAFAVPRTMRTFAPGDGTGDSGLGPYGLLSARLDELVEVVEVGAIPPERRLRAEYAGWSAVHGLSTLFNGGPICLRS